MDVTLRTAKGICIKSMKKNLVPVLLGPPGIGKSELVYQIAKDMNLKVIELRLSYRCPLDMIGLPQVKVVDGIDTATWAVPEFLPREAGVLLFADELTNAQLATLHSAYEMMLEKRVGKWKLPENSYIIAAGNRKQDKCGVQELPAALRNRLMNLSLRADKDTWKDWALHNGIHPAVIGFLDFRPNLLWCYDHNKHTMAFPTPRSWTQVSNYIIDNDVEMEAVAGLVGDGEAGEFMTFYHVQHKLPPVEKVLNGEKVDLPNDQAVNFAFVAGLVSQVVPLWNGSKVNGDAARKTLNALKWLTTRDKEWFTLGALDICRCPEFKKNITKLSTQEPELWKQVREPLTKVMGEIIGKGE